MSEKSPDKVTGGCLCGAIRFVVTLPSLWTSHCHCTLCRRAHGAAFVSWVGVTDKQFAYTGDIDELGSYASSDDAVRNFCSRCGTSFLFRSRRWPGETHVALACLDGPIDRAMENHAYPEDRVSWISLQGLPVTGRNAGTAQ